MYVIILYRIGVLDMKKELCYEEILNNVHSSMYDSSLIELLEEARIAVSQGLVYPAEEVLQDLISNG